MNREEYLNLSVGSTVVHGNKGRGGCYERGKYQQREQEDGQDLKCFAPVCCYVSKVRVSTEMLCEEAGAFAAKRGCSISKESESSSK